MPGTTSLPITLSRPHRLQEVPNSQRMALPSAFKSLSTWSTQLKTLFSGQAEGFSLEVPDIHPYTPNSRPMCQMG